MSAIPQITDNNFRITQCSNSNLQVVKSYHEYVVIDLKGTYDHHNCRSILYKVLAIASVVAFIALGVISLIPCVEALAFFPVVLFSVMFTLPIFHRNIYKPLDACHEEHEKQAQLAEEIQSEEKKLPFSNEEMQKILKDEMDIDLADIQADNVKQSPHILSKVVARYRVMEKTQQSVDTKIEEFQKMLKEDETDEGKMALKQRLLTLKELDRSQIRVELAWIHHILRCPYEQNNSSDYVEFIHSPAWRAVAQRLNEPDYDHIIKFKNSTKENMTTKELDGFTSIKDLSIRLYG